MLGGVPGAGAVTIIRIGNKFTFWIPRAEQREECIGITTVCSFIYIYTRKF